MPVVKGENRCVNISAAFSIQYFPGLADPEPSPCNHTPCGDRYGTRAS